MNIDPRTRAAGFAVGKALPVPAGVAVPVSLASFFLSQILSPGQSPEEAGRAANDALRMQRSPQVYGRSNTGPQGAENRNVETKYLGKMIRKGRVAQEQGAGRVLNPRISGFLERQGNTRGPRDLGDAFRKGVMDAAISDFGSPMLQARRDERAMKARRADLRGGGR